MTMTIGGVTIPLDEQPDAGEYPFARAQRWSSIPALGLVGSIQQMSGTDPLRFRLHFTPSQATLDDLQALYDSQANGSGPWALINDALPEPYATGFDVIMQEFRPVLVDANRGLPWFDLWILFEEVVS
jgi:hypothetical protein